MTTQLTRPDRFSIEANLNLGDRGRSEKRRRVDELYVAGLEAYAEGNLVRAIAYWESALEIDPTFQPAAKNIDVAERAIELREKMEELNRVD
jgi:tetratricopeptide (TPR) repeat protein